MRYLLAAALVLAATQANAASIDAPPGVPQATIDALVAMIPVPAPTVPPMETPAGAAGNTMTFRRGDAVQPRITRAAICTTGSDGTCSVSWLALMATPIIVPVPTVASNAVQAPLCFPVEGSVTLTAATVKCFTSQAVTVNVLGAVISPITTAGTGIKVQVFAVPLS